MKPLAALAPLLLLACQGQPGPTGPDPTAKATTSQTADSASCVVINISGETIIYQGNNPDTTHVTVYDTIAVDTADSGLGQEFGLVTEPLYSFEYQSGGWTVTDDRYTPESVSAIYFRRNRIDGGDGGYSWMEFSAFAEANTSSFLTKPTYEIGEGEIRIHDPDRTIFFAYIGILLGG